MSAYDLTKFAAEIVALERRLHDAGLHKSAAAMNKVSGALGWEIAEAIERQNSAKDQA